MKRILITVSVTAIAVLLFMYFKPAEIQFAQSGFAPPSHQLWDELLKNHVDESGKVNYKGFIADSVKLNEYLKLLGDNPPDITIWTENDRKAYWINIYNAYTVLLVTRYYPVQSIKDIGGVIQIPFVNSPWDMEFITIGKKKMDLNDVEHNILRKKFDDPRIHFAINCASISCPQLRNEAYTANKLNVQLEEQARSFINDVSKNRLTAEKVWLSKIFLWFKGDFTKNKSLIEFLNRYSAVKLNPKATIKYLDYSWGLNE